MNSETKDFIKELVNDIVSEYDIKIPIDNIADVIKKMGGTIEERACFNELVEGTIKRIDNEHFVIAVAKHLSANDKNYLIAAELGHLFLHLGFGTDQSHWESVPTNEFIRFKTLTQDYQANEFAACLLLPEELYLKKLKEYENEDGINIHAVAKYFNVSLAEVIDRGKDLGYL